LISFRVGYVTLGSELLERTDPCGNESEHLQQPGRGQNKYQAVMCFLR